MRRISILLLVGFLLTSVRGFTQITNKGTEFWVSYGHHQFMEQGGNSQQMVLYLSNTENVAAKVKVELYGSGTPPIVPSWTRTYTIPPNSVIQTETTQADTWTPNNANNTGIGAMPKSGPYDSRLYVTGSNADAKGGVGKFKAKAFQITSTNGVPIVAYSHIYGSAASGATMLLPTAAWGYNYTSINSKQAYASNCFSWMYVIAKDNNTVIEVTPTVKTQYQNTSGLQPNVTKTISLSKGQVFQILGANLSSDANGEGGSSSDGYELTGTTVRSVPGPDGICKPIAVFSGSSRTYNPMGCGSGGGDNDMQQGFPEHTWGKRYLTAPTSNSVSASTFQTNGFRVVVKDPTTVVRRNGTVLSGLISGRYYYYESSTADYIEADKPVAVAQFMSGGSCLNGGVGDPEMVYISPIEQGIKKIAFYRNTLEGISVNYLTLIVPDAGMSTLKIDGALNNYDHVYNHPAYPGYKVVVKRWTAAQAVGKAESSEKFNAITYGLGSVESYAFNAGTNLENIAGSSVKNVPDTSSAQESPFNCAQTPVKISAVLDFQPTSITWKLSNVSNISPNADVVMTSPVPKVSGNSFIYTLPGEYTFSQPGDYTIEIVTTNPLANSCSSTETFALKLTVKPMPSADFTFDPHSGCPSDSVQFHGPNTSGTTNVVKWLWEFEPGKTDSVKNPYYHFATSGSYPVKLKAVADGGCIAEKTKTVTVSAPQPPTFTLSASQICEGGSVTITPGPEASTEWYWDFGDGRKDTLTAATPFTVKFDTFGVFTIKESIKLPGGCAASGASVKQLTVYANPRIGFTYPTGCLPPTGVVQFTDTSSVPDGAHQAINSWSWNFGDGNATASNPNTSTAKNPSHIYQYGNYTLHLKVTTDKGCSSDSTWTDNFKVTPVVALAALSAVCENVPPYSIASRASVTNGVPGTGKFEGNGVDAAGMFDPKIAGVGTHTISYIFESTGGCTDTAKQNIIVHPVPKADFSFVSSCVNSDGKVQFTDKSTISGGGTLMTNWDFGDGSPAVVTKNPLHAYTAEGSYPVKLTVGGAYNCMHDTTITAVVSIKPAISFGSVGDACISANTTVDLNTLVSITNGIAGSGVFSGPGVSGHNFNSAVAGEGTHAIKYVFTTTGGCKDSVTKNIAVKARPHPSFTYPSGCLNSDGKMSFTNTSTIGATETIASYSWDFGDGTPAVTTKDPIHTFSAEGTYQVKLTAKSAFGCSHDTTVAVVVKIGPAVSFSPLTAVCGNASAVDLSSKVVPVSGAAGTGVFSGAGISGSNFDPAVAGVGTHLLKYEYTTAGGCVASATQNIVVNAVPRPTFDFPSGCLSDNGEVQFTNTTKVSSGATVQSWSWDFGDVNATPTNPNTSTVKNPSHKYLEGSYTIQLKATYTSGCSGDTTATVSFTTLPKLGTVPAVAPVCENSTTAITLPAPPVLNAVPMGSQSFSGKGITDAATGLFDATLAGAGTHIIKYTYTSPSGCAASVNFSVQVYPKPAASFTVNKASLCLNDQLLFTDNSTVGAGNTIAKWEWNFGDGTPLRVDHTAPGNFTYAYPGEGSYTAVLKATSDKGCEGTSAPRIIKMNPLPKITNMQLPAVVCMPEGKASFSADATVSDGSTLKYLWNFGDGQSSSQRQPTITYSSAPGAGGYSIALQVKTAAGCIDTMRKQLTDFSNQPVAKFTTATDLCQGTESLFTNQSTAGGAPLKDYLWNFGDGRTSGDKNPNKVYIAAGSYNVSLQVRDDKGCMAAAPYTMAVKVHLQPKVDAGPTVVLKPGEYGQFKPKVNDSVNVNLMWSVQSGKPSGIVDPTKLSAWVKAIAEDTRYYLTGVGSYNCTAVDSVLVKVLQTVKIPNAFSPNGDGINDKWVIEGLADYPGHSIEVFSRQGKIVYSSQNYQQPWDGTFNGKALPAGTYYYVIDPKNGLPVMTGWIYMSK